MAAAVGPEASQRREKITSIAGYPHDVRPTNSLTANEENDHDSYASRYRKTSIEL